MNTTGHTDDQQITTTLKHLPIRDVIARQYPMSIVITDVEDSNKVITAIYKPTCNILGYKKSRGHKYEAYGYRISFNTPIYFTTEQKPVVSGVIGQLYNLHLHLQGIRRPTEIHKVYLTATHITADDKTMTYNLFIELLRHDSPYLQ